MAALEEDLVAVLAAEEVEGVADSEEVLIVASEVERATEDIQVSIE